MLCLSITSVKHVFNIWWRYGCYVADQELCGGTSVLRRGLNLLYLN